MDQPSRRQSLKPLAIGALIAMLTIVAVVAGVHLSGCCWKTPPATPPATVAPAPSPASADTGATWTPSEPAVPDDVHIAWAYLDSAGGTHASSPGDELHPLDQLVVPGVAADYLHQLQQRDHTLSPKNAGILFSALAQNRDVGEHLTDLAGGLDVVIPRIVDVCSLTETRPGPPRATVLDTARYAACLREGAIADRGTSDWVLDRMRDTPGGIGDVRGDDGGQRLAQFNSNEPAGDGRTRTGCIGVGAFWSAAVFVDWPTDRGEMYGVAACAEVARTKFPPDTQQAPGTPTPAATP